MSENDVSIFSDVHSFLDSCWQPVAWWPGLVGAFRIIFRSGRVFLLGRNVLHGKGPLQSTVGVENKLLLQVHVGRERW